jgi:hypothetical protein
VGATSPDCYWKVTGNVSVLLAVFFSPGTFEIVAVIVYVPAGGEALSVTLQVACCPGVVSGTVALPLMPPELNVTLQPMLCSVLVPPLVKFSVNDGGGLAGIVLVDPVCKVVPPTLTESSE